MQSHPISLATSIKLAAQVSKFHLRKRHPKPSFNLPRTPVSDDEIDAVYLWKDDSDASWVSDRRAYAESCRGKHRYNLSVLLDNAVKPSLDEFRYSLRSLATYFPSLRRLYLVTDGRPPDWFNTDHPAAVHVDLHDLIDDPEVLPSYNSQAIESYFYTMPGLSEHFIYFNDDFFLARPVTARDFFLPDGGIHVRLGRALSPKGYTHVRERGDTSAHKNANRILDDRFEPETRLTVMHRPYALTRSLYEHVMAACPEAFRATRFSHFRSVEMVGMHNCLLPFWAYYGGGAQLHPPRILEKDMYLWTNDAAANDAVIRRILRVSSIGFCLQENNDEKFGEAAVRQFHRHMDRLYPTPSPFEITS